MEALTLTDLADLFMTVSLVLGSFITFSLGFIAGLLR
jgi:hypothetical protein